MKKSGLFKYLTVLISFVVLICVASCAGSSAAREEKIHLAIENQASEKDKSAITVTVEFNGKVLGEKQKVESGTPFSLIKSLPKGNNNISIKEEETGAVYKSTIVLENEKWLKVAFYRQSKGMGYFEAKLQDRPFGYEAEKSDGKNKEELKDKKNSEDEIDKKLDELGKNVKKPNHNKKKSN
ncbi:MAG: hypothetical protein LWY06_13850 [Firmicutes bacterium]|nr:hypothetical protein [Bacillota bacterium]